MRRRCARESTISTASLALSQGNSIPATVEVLDQARQMGLKLELDDMLLKKIDDHFHWVAYSEKNLSARGCLLIEIVTQSMRRIKFPAA